MSSFLSRASKFSRSISRILQPAVSLSSSATLFDDALKSSQKLVMDKFKEQGFTGSLNLTSSSFNKNDLQALKVSFEQASKCDILPCGIEGTNYAVQHSF